MSRYYQRLTSHRNSSSLIQKTSYRLSRELHPKWPQTKTATDETKIATLKVQNRHTPKRPKQKRPHQKSSETWKYLASERMLSLPTLTLLLVYDYIFIKDQWLGINAIRPFRGRLNTCSDLNEWAYADAYSLTFLGVKVAPRGSFANSIFPVHSVLSDHCLSCPVSDIGILVKRLDGSRCHWYGGRPRPRLHCLRWRLSSLPTERGTALWPSGRPSQQLYWALVKRNSPEPCDRILSMWRSVIASNTAWFAC